MTECRCPSCGNQTAGTREGDTEHCTTCGAVLGPAFTAEPPRYCLGCDEPIRDGSFCKLCCCDRSEHDYYRTTP